MGLIFIGKAYINFAIGAVLVDIHEAHVAMTGAFIAHIFPKVRSPIRISFFSRVKHILE